MSHDTEAAYAASEIARGMASDTWSVYAGREGGRDWPLTDGVIVADNIGNHSSLKLAFEYKRPNEGVHGVLTALGQSIAYLEKGYHASVIVLPENYMTLKRPGDYLLNVLKRVESNARIGIYEYSEPDLSSLSPFAGKLRCIKQIKLEEICKQSSNAHPLKIAKEKISTLWAHTREGMSYPDAFFRYCQSLKVVSAGYDGNYEQLPSGLCEAAQKLSKGKNVYDYLASVSGNSVADRAWKFTWFNFYFHSDTWPIWRKIGRKYVVNDACTKIHIPKSNCQVLWTNRSDSIKKEIVDDLNSNKITIDSAWSIFAKRIRRDAHSYREVIDSGLFHIGFISADGTLTDLGYKFVDACERFDSSDAPLPFEILRSAFLHNGQYAAMLHYLYKVSENMFEEDIFSYTYTLKNGKLKFKKKAYLSALYAHFVQDLHIVKTTTGRNPENKRGPFQAELSFLNMLGLLMKDANGHPLFKVGTGLVINWEEVQKSLSFITSR